MVLHNIGQQRIYTAPSFVEAVILDDIRIATICIADDEMIMKFHWSGTRTHIIEVKEERIQFASYRQLHRCFFQSNLRCYSFTRGFPQQSRTRASPSNNPFGHIRPLYNVRVSLNRPNLGKTSEGWYSTLPAIHMRLKLQRRV
jgi:hypothetical protein